MFDWFSKDENAAISILKTDHDNVKELFDQFEKADGPASKRKISRQAINELKVHAAIEEEIFYPAVRQRMDDKDLMNEADEEHHVAHVLIAELDRMDGTEDHYNAKFTVLAENVRHHIKEEEGEMFPKARSLDIDFLELGQQILWRKRSAKPAAKRTALAPRKRRAA
jgi:hemerythrin superfamily protein